MTEVVIVVMSSKPVCPAEATHGVVVVRTQGTFEHHWTCLTCRTKFSRAPDRDPDECEKFEY